MDPRLEDELLMHIAAGTDPLTAFAALPRDDEQLPPPQGSRHRSNGWFALALLIAIVLLLLLR
jgi:hypothetical protein